MTLDVAELADWRDNIEARVSRLEATSDQQVAKADYQGALLMSMDEDLGKIQVEFRAQRALLQALRTTQVEDSARISRLEAGQQELRAGQARLLAGVESIIGLLTQEPGSEN